MKAKRGMKKPSLSLWQRLFKALFLFWRRTNGSARKQGGSWPIFVFSGIGLLLINACFPSAKPYDQAFEASPQSIDCRLDRVLDGDTVTAYCQNRYLSIRLLGIDAPEKGQIPWGEQSRQVLQRLMRTEFSLLPQGKDIYQRQLGVIMVQGRDINLAMLAQGQAVLYRSKETPTAYAAAEKAARTQKIGVWAQKGAQQNPSRWRREHQ